MKLRELLSKLKEVQVKIGVSSAFICGGTPRDKYMNRLDNISDIDLTNGTKTIDYLSQEFAIELRKQYAATRKTMSDGHSTIFIGNLKIDFSSNFIVPNIDQILKDKGIEHSTDMQKEMYSRDFTCNTLLLSLDLKRIMDPLDQGFKDIKEKKIRTCLDPSITLTSNRNRVVRAIYLACKLGFEIDESIISFVQKYPETVKVSTEKVLTEKLNEAFQKDPEKASKYLTQMHLWELVPITKIMQPYYVKRSNVI